MGTILRTALVHGIRKAASTHKSRLDFLHRTMLGITILFALCAVLTPDAVNAQSYPVKPVRLVIASGAGGSDDFHGRILVQELTKMLGQQFVADNRPGAGGVIAQEFVAKSPADAYTLLLGGGSMTGAQFVRANLPFDVMRDFAPVSLLTNLQSCLVVHPAVPAQSVKEFIALARGRPGKLNFGSGGVGQTMYFSAAYFNGMAKLSTVHVPYKSVSGIYSDAIAGQIDFVFAPMSSAAVYAHSGKLRALGVTGAKRSPALPEVPTIAEAALPGYEMTSWLSILVPAATPRPLIDTINMAMVRLIAMPDNRERMLKAGSEPASSTPEELAKRMAEGVEKYGRIAKLAGIKPE